MKKHLTWMPLLLLWACAPTGGGAERGPVDTQVGLLLPATSTEARNLGVLGWELRMSDLGMQVSGIAEGDRRFGTALFTLRRHEGIDGALLVVQAKLGARGQLAYAADGTVVENTLGNVPGAVPWFGAMHADLGLLAGREIVPYAGAGECAWTAAGTAVTCIGTVAGIAECGPTFGLGCGLGMASAPFCGSGLVDTYRCATGSTPSSDTSGDCTSGPEMGVPCTTGDGTGSDPYGDGTGSDPYGDGSGSDPYGDGSGSDPYGDGSGAGDSAGSGDGSSGDPWGADDSYDPWGSGDGSGDGSGSDPYGDGSGGSGSDPSGSGSGGDDFSGDWGGSDFGGSDSDGDGWEDDWTSGGTDDSWSSSDSSWDDYGGGGGDYSGGGGDYGDSSGSDFGGGDYGDSGGGGW